MTQELTTAMMRERMELTEAAASHRISELLTLNQRQQFRIADLEHFNAMLQRVIVRKDNELRILRGQ